MTAIPDNVSVLPDGSTIPVVSIAGTVALASSVTVSNFPGTQAVSGTIGVVLPSLVAGSATIGNVGIVGVPTVQGALTTVPQTGTIGGYIAMAVGTLDSVVLAGAQSVPGTTRRYLDLSNPSGTVAVYVNFGAPATIGNAPVILAPGTPRGDVRTWEGAFVPSDDIHCVASAPTSFWIGSR
jgi:hypothetical protein